MTDLNNKIKELNKSNEVVLYMKGNQHFHSVDFLQLLFKYLNMLA